MKNSSFFYLKNLPLIFFLLTVKFSDIYGQSPNDKLRAAIYFTNGSRGEWESKVVSAIRDSADDKSLYTELLFQAVWWGDLEILKMAIQKGGNINARRASDDDNTLLHYTAIYGDRYPMCPLINYLNTNGNNLISVRNKSGDTPYDLVSRIIYTVQNSQDIKECFNRYIIEREKRRISEEVRKKQEQENQYQINKGNKKCGNSFYDPQTQICCCCYNQGCTIYTKKTDWGEFKECYEFHICPTK